VKATAWGAATGGTARPSAQTAKLPRALPVNPRVLIAGAVAAAAILVVLWPSSDFDTEPLELTDTAPPPPRVNTDAPASPETANQRAEASLMPPAVSPASAAGMTLHGVFGDIAGQGSAIIGLPDGQQRLIRVGRAIAPGMILQTVERKSVTLLVNGQQVRLAFPEAIGEGERPSAGNTVPPAGEADALQRARKETTQFRLGLAPRQQGGRVTGYAIKPNASMPIFDRAGLRPGDVITLVNGQAFESQEKVLELSDEIAGSNTVEFDFERNGQKMKAAVKIK